MPIAKACLEFSGYYATGSATSVIDGGAGETMKRRSTSSFST
ncbi:hypothetical protein OK016_11990 [Vibrio chagasii]|nr:hypothetical protein [Vibrio chagasii]